MSSPSRTVSPSTAFTIPHSSGTDSVILHPARVVTVTTPRRTSTSTRQPSSFGSKAQAPSSGSDVALVASIGRSREFTALARLRRLPPRRGGEPLAVNDAAQVRCGLAVGGLSALPVVLDEDLRAVALPLRDGRHAEPRVEELAGRELPP